MGKVLFVLQKLEEEVLKDDSPPLKGETEGSTTKVPARIREIITRNLSPGNNACSHIQKTSLLVIMHVVIYKKPLFW